MVAQNPMTVYVPLLGLTLGAVGYHMSMGERRNPAKVASYV